MSMIMNHDITSLMGQRMLQKNSLAMRRSLEKLSSGLRTKIADVDNTAGLAISETMRSRIYGMEKALYNTEDGISLIQTANGALEQTQGMLMRMRELSVQAANDTLTQQDRSYIQVEINEIRDEITRLAETTQFNRKKILSGDNAVLWSSTDNNMKAIINGGLRSIDNYGQKYAVDGNFKISVKSDIGKAQIQKTDIFRVKHDDTITDKSINTSAGVRSVSVSGEITAGNYSLTAGEADEGAAVITGAFGIGEGSDGSRVNVSEVFGLEVGDNMDVNASILFEVKSIDAENGRVALKATADVMTREGVFSRTTNDNIILVDGEEGVNLSDMFGQESLSISLNGVDYVNEGAKFSVNVSAQPPENNAINISLSGIADSADPEKWDGAPFSGQTVNYTLDGSKTGNRELNFRNFFVNNKTGQATEGTITLETSSGFTADRLDLTEDVTAADFTVSYVGKVADGNTKLRDIDKFWDGEGNFILENPKSLTLTQGDGKQARIMLYADDTLDSAAKKLNDAVANGLGQAKYVDDATKFVSFVAGETSGLEAVGGTMVVRSVLTGAKGEISLTGSEDILKALSLNTLQESAETKYSVTVRDAHDGALIADSVKITGNRLVGVIHKNVDVEFDPMMGITAAWNSSTKNFDLNDTASSNGTEALLHLADNTTIFQTGTVEGEDVMIAIGDMSSHALGLDGVNVMSRDRAAQSTGIIDTAIDKVSMQMAKLGASQNRLEHHLGNLTDEMQALTEANSNIRDTEYMSEMMEYTRIRILMESNAVMLAQSNEMQRSSILGLLR